MMKDDFMTISLTIGQNSELDNDQFFKIIHADSLENLLYNSGILDARL